MWDIPDTLKGGAGGTYGVLMIPCLITGALVLHF